MMFGALLAKDKFFGKVEDVAYELGTLYQYKDAQCPNNGSLLF